MEPPAPPSQEQSIKSQRQSKLPSSSSRVRPTDSTNKSQLPTKHTGPLISSSSFSRCEKNKAEQSLATLHMREQLPKPDYSERDLADFDSQKTESESPKAIILSCMKRFKILNVCEQMMVNKFGNEQRTTRIMLYLQRSMTQSQSLLSPYLKMAVSTKSAPTTWPIRSHISRSTRSKRELETAKPQSQEFTPTTRRSPHEHREDWTLPEEITTKTMPQRARRTHRYLHSDDLLIRAQLRNPESDLHLLYPLIATNLVV